MVSMQHYCKLATALLLCCSLTAPADGAELPPGDGLLAEANQAFSDANYNRAVALYTKILARDENQDTAYALEYLGLARERKNQLAHAKAIYSDYLQRYPEGEGHDRVNQRLQAVLSIGREPALRQIADKGLNSDRSAWQIYGSSSSTYR
jgi:outer membrane protein assembly factor BamD (BamD/ComL family)